MTNPNKVTQTQEDGNTLWCENFQGVLIAKVWYHEETKQYFLYNLTHENEEPKTFNRWEAVQAYFESTKWLGQ